VVEEEIPAWAAVTSTRKWSIFSGQLDLKDVCLCLAPTAKSPLPQFPLTCKMQVNIFISKEGEIVN